MLLKTRDDKMKKVALPAFISGIFGVTEPAIYGVTLPKKKPFIYSCIGGAVGGAFIGFMGTRSFTMGGLGSDAAIEAADVVLMDDKPSKIAVAIRIAQKTLVIVRQNIAFALGVKALVLVLGALGQANMWEAVFADVGVSVIAILNAMRAMKGPDQK